MKSNLTRREMLLGSAGAVAGMTFLSSCTPGSKKTDSCRKVSKTEGFKIGACDWSLGKGCDVEAMRVAKELNLDGVQVSLGSYENNMHLRKPEVQQAYFDACKKYDVEVGSIAIGALNGYPYKSDAIAEEWVWDSVDVAKAMNQKVILLAFFGKGDLKNDKAGVDEVVRRLKKVAPKAEKAGVYLAVESTLNAEEHMDIIDRVGSSAVKVYYDVGNSHAGGYDIYKEIRFLGSNICEFHAKDYEFIFGQGNVDFVKVRQAMDDIGYRGWIQIEGAQPLGMEESYRLNEKYLRTVFPLKV